MKLLEYRFRPKSEYIIKAPWKELYTLTEYWKKELSFYEEEILFYEKLVEAYNSDNSPKLAELSNMLRDAEGQLKAINAQTDEHLLHIKEILEKSDNSQDLLFKEEHNVLEDNIAAFIKAFRQIRQSLMDEIQHHIQQPATAGAGR